MILSLVTMRGVSWCGADHVWCLVSYLARSRGDLVPGTLIRLLSVWSDPVEIDQADSHKTCQHLTFEFKIKFQI